MLKRRNNFQQGGAVQRAYEEYQRRIGQPFQQTVRGGVRGYFGLPLMSDADETGKEAYRQAEAIGSMPGVGVPAKITRGASDVIQTAPALAAGAIGLVKKTKKETPIAFKADEIFLAAAQKDLEKAKEKYLFIDDMQRDAQGVIPKKLKNLDRGLIKGDYTEQQIKEAFSDTRKALKDRYGEKLVLYRADAPKEERLADAKTVYMGDESLANRFEQQGRKTQPYTVDVDDVLGVYTTRSGYYEVIVKKEALEKSAKAKEPKMAKGGMMARNIPGFQEGGTNIDPVSGNEVPTGSLPEEVRDDVDAKLSPGEFVIPADVVRFIGLERLMKMRDEAKKGLQRMSDIGQMGNAEEVGEESNSTYEENDNFENEVDDILEEIESEQGDTNEQTEKMMAQGGFLKSGTDLTKAPKNPVFDVRYYKNDQGSVMYITHINGKPMTPIPEGFKVVSQEDAQKVGQAADEAKKAATPATGAVGAGGAASGQEGPGMPSMTPAQQQQMDADIASGQQNLTMQQLNQTLTNIAGKSTPIALTKGLSGLLSPLTASLSGQALDPNEALLQESQDVNPSSPASVGGPSAAAAAQSAASAAMESGHSNAASIAAANAAAEAINNGASPAEAAQAGENAAGAVDSLSDIAEAGSTGAGPSIGGIGDVSEGSGEDSSYASGGLINRRQYPKKKTRGKGLAATK